MIESVVALLMFVNAEIKEARLQVDGMAMCFSVSAKRKEPILNLLPTNVGRVRQN